MLLLHRMQALVWFMRRMTANFIWDCAGDKVSQKESRLIERITRYVRFDGTPVVQCVSVGVCGYGF
jgi:hypothetical protein